MSNVYHILDKTPAFIAEDMSYELEELAIKLVESGQLRIDAEYKHNYINYRNPDTKESIMFSHQELLDEKLQEKTLDRLTKTYKNRLNNDLLTKKVKIEFNKLADEARKQVGFDFEEMLYIARLLVQATNPIVMRWILLESTEVFVSFSYEIGNLMDIKGWQTAGRNSGMQSTDGRSTAVFVSCGGNPMEENLEATRKELGGNGWPAISRLLVIAAQELGHFADIIRNEQGQQISRHSADFGGRKAKESVRLARLEDIEACHKLLAGLQQCGLEKLVFNENQISFYYDNKVRNLMFYFYKFKVFIHRYLFLAAAEKKKYHFVKLFKRDLHMGLMIRLMLKDMLDNLTPKADVYKNSNPDVEEAIACIEALARVPQQVIKWGHLSSRRCMGNLYQVYYGQVIPDLVAKYEIVTGEKYQRNFAKFRKPKLLTRIKRFLRVEKKLAPPRTLR